MIKSFKELARLSDSITYLYMEHCHIEQDNFAVKRVTEFGEVSIPCAGLTTLLLGPGTTITHAAMVSLSKCGCMVIWCGENLRKYYACGFAETHSAANILKQAKACMDDGLHMEVVKKMYQKRYGNINIENMSLQQLRSMEGNRVKNVYALNSKLYKVSWVGRRYKNQKYEYMDNINKAISCANDLLYSLCSAVISTMGYNLSLGFVHIGNINSFVFDIADLYKEEVSIPCAFEVVSKLNHNISLEQQVRELSRTYYKKLKIMNRMVNDINDLFDNIIIKSGNYSEDALWNVDGDVSGKKNYNGEVE